MLRFIEHSLQTIEFKEMNEVLEKQFQFISNEIAQLLL